MSVTEKDMAVVIVTYCRQELLSQLFTSFCRQNMLPQHIVVVDNENSSQTCQMVQNLDQQLLNCQVHYVPLLTNTGGAGGFSKGVEYAYNLGTQWLWLMDDDVQLLDNAIEKIVPWLQNAVANNNRVMQVQRKNFDGTDFYWQYQFNTQLGIPNPFAPSQFAPHERYRIMNTACFEGGLFHRSVVGEIGFPDYRFFIYSDDTVYGYIASKITTPILINETVLARTRVLEHFKVGNIRKLNSTSDLSRYYIMRNRGYIAQYFRLNGDYNPIMFTVGTILTLGKEILRLFITKSFRTGLPRLLAGMFDGKRIRKDKSFLPMPIACLASQNFANQKSFSSTNANQLIKGGDSY